MAVIAGGRYARGLQKTLSIKGEVCIPDLDSALQAGYDLPTAERQIDTGFLYGWRTYQADTFVALVGGNNSFVTLQNPANSGLVVIFDELQLISDTVQSPTLVISLFSNQGAGTSFGSAIDARSAVSVSNRNNSGARLRLFNNATTLGQTIARLPADAFLSATLTRFVYRLPHILIPGDDLNFTPSIQAVGLNGTIRWRERALDSSELTA